jgi:hypothetical protein
MRFSIRVLPSAALLAGSIAAAATAQAPAAEAAPAALTPTPAPAPLAAPALVPPAPTPNTSLRITDPAVIAIARLPAENPFGSTAQVPAALPTKLPFDDAALASAAFVSVRVDPTGKALSVRRERDPIPSLSAEELKSLSRWSFTPARRGGQAVETWGAYKLGLYVEIRAPKILQLAFMPISPTTPIPAPLAWPSDDAWFDSRKPPAPNDGTVPIDQVDTAPLPQKTPWTADSFKGPFSVKFWVRVDKAGRIDRAIPLEASDPVLLPYFRRTMGTWILRPAQTNGVPVESWNELTLGGQISYSTEVKQIAALRRPIGPDSK